MFRGKYLALALLAALAGWTQGAVAAEQKTTRRSRQKPEDRRGQGISFRDLVRRLHGATSSTSRTQAI